MRLQLLLNQLPTPAADLADLVGELQEALKVGVTESVPDSGQEPMADEVAGAGEVAVGVVALPGEVTLGEVVLKRLSADHQQGSDQGDGRALPDGAGGGDAR